DNLPADASLNANTGKFDWKPGYSAAAQSPYKLRITALDGKGGSYPVDVTINVADKNQNPVFVVLPIQAFAEGTTSSFTVSATDADGDNLTYSCNNKPVGATFDTSTGKFIWTPGYTAYKATPYEFNFTVSDGWGGTADLTVKVSVAEVNQAPAFTDFTVPSFSEGIAGTFTLAANDPDGESMTYSCANLPAGALLNPDTGVFNWNPSFSAAQVAAYILNFTVTDSRGATGSCQVTIVVADVNQKPVFNEIVPPVFVENVQGRFTITATDADDDIIRYSCNSLPVGAEFINTTGQFTWTPSYSDATGETIDLLFEANDGKGGKDTITVSLMVQDSNRLPVFKNATSYSVNTGNKLTIKVVAEDLDKDEVTISCVSKPEGSDFDDSEATLSWTPAKGAAGSYVAVFTASDNKGQPVSFTINILVDSVNQAPVLEPISPLTVNEGSTLSFSAKATDVNDDILTFSIENAPAGASINSSTGSFSWMPDYEAAGTYEFAIKVFDGLLYIGRNVTVVVKNTNRAPAINITGETTVRYNDGLKLSFTASDPDGDAVTVSATDLPGSAVINRSAGSIIWSTTKSSVGSYSFIVTASDGKITTDKQVTVTIIDDQPQPTNTPPVIAAISDKVINEGESLNFAVSATDADGDNVTITATSLPSGAYFANNSFRWESIAVLPGTYSVTFIASDGINSSTETVNITVSDVNYKPVVDRIDTQKAIIGMPLTVTINATDPDGDILTYTLKTKLDSLAFTGNVITWTPADKYLGDNKISFSVSDGKFVVDDSFNILVESVTADSISPEIVGLNPKPDAIQVPLNPLVLITLSDAGSGIDLSTVNITMDGTTIYSGALASESEDLLYSVSGNKCSCSGTPARYVFQYQASDLFDYDYRPVITISASDLSGNVMKSYSYSFTTEMYSMCAAIPVEPTSMSKKPQQGHPDVVTAPDGTIWSAWDDGNKVYLSPYYESLGRFDTALTFNTSGKQIEPALAIASDGSIYLAWQDNSAGNWDICIVRSADGRNFNPVQTITSGQDHQTAPSISVDDSGNVYIVFVSDSKNTGSDICLARANSDITSVTESVICNATGDQKAPTVTSGSGIVVVAWEDYRSGSAAVYAADSASGWANTKLVNTGSQPDIVKDQQRSVLHTTWVSNADIYYAEIALPLSGKAFVARNIIDDTANLAQLSPSITHNYRNGKPRTFVAWSDSRNNEGNNDNDIYFASVHRSAGTNVLATLDSDMTSQGQPAMAITRDGAPYIVFQNDSQAGKTVEMACATVIKSVLEKTYISAREGGVVGTSSENITSLEDVSIKVMPGSLTTDTELTIAQVSNPPADGSGLRSLFSYDFGPSSTREFRKPVKITIPYPTTLDGAAVSVYWYNPQTGTYTQTGMSNVEVKRINGEISAISFDTTHFCQYSLSTEYIPAIITEGQ
ncbi:MAG: tandem-95 repeat protein, partial [Sedimentisphaerales bacterium]|nr:tandem-95 repeat protein [Sedimentisphaerales bacterium]